MPYEGYWQQDVHYEINAEINAEDNTIYANQTLTYWNNSPDELDYVYFHLYQNAFKEDSYYTELKKINYRVDPEFDGFGVGTEISSISSNGEELDKELDNTILKVYLKEPLKSGEMMSFDIDFKTYFNEFPYGRRMKYYHSYDGEASEEVKNMKHYNGVHWYPRICVYDSKFGWTTDQHLVKEFYGNFGTFDVQLTFPDNYIVEATGNMTNRDEVLPDKLMEKINVKNFANKQWESEPSVITKYNPNSKKTWIFHAENVHDFAFTADPTYRIGVAEWNGIMCYSMVQEHHAAGWQNAAEYTAKAVQVFSEDIGMYTYHKMIVADARDGMEYPMLTLDGGFDPYYRDLLVHEIGHNWFHGQVGTNETYRASLDEGFTQFLTAWGLNKIDGPYSAEAPKSRLFKDVEFPLLAIDEEIYNRYMSDATIYNTPKLNTHSHDFGSALRHGGGYRHVYYKPAVMLYNLQYVLGDDLFLAAMQNYFQQWKMAHPYFNDFRNSFIHFTKVDLNWFFDQWIETEKGLDYSIGKVEKIDDANYTIEINRKSTSMEMPLDISVDSKFGIRQNFHIPNKDFIKETKAKVLPKWTGFGKLNTSYTFSVHIPDSTGIKNIIIDPTNRLGDNYMLNNRLVGNSKISLDYGVRTYPDWKFYEFKTRPAIDYNGYDGVKIGLRMKGGYLNTHHVFNSYLLLNTTLFNDAAWNENVGNDIVSYGFDYTTSLDEYVKNSHFSSSLTHLDGLDAHSFSLTVHDQSENNKISIGYKGMIRRDYSDFNYLLNENLWGPNEFRPYDSSSREDMYNSTISIDFNHKYKYVKGSGNINLSLRSSSWLSDYNFSQLSFSVINHNNIFGLKLKTRSFLQIGVGELFPIESMLFAAGANPEEMMNHSLSRSYGLITSKENANYGIGTGNLHFGGGLNLRGYAGNYLEETIDGETKHTYYGTSGFAMNMEVEYSDYLKTLISGSSFEFLNNIPVLSSIDSYLFFDAGAISTNDPKDRISFGSFRTDFGIGLTYDISKPFDEYYSAKPLILRFDFPIFVSDPPSTESNFKFRWMFGVNKSF